MDAEFEQMVREEAEFITWERNYKPDRDGIFVRLSTGELYRFTDEKVDYLREQWVKDRPWWLERLQ